MAERHAKARAIREFLVKAETEMEKDEFIGTPGVAEWLAWAKAHAEAIDPLLRPREIPKRLEPVRDEGEGQRSS